MSETTEEQLQKMVATLNEQGLISANLSWTFDTDGKTASEIYGVFSYGWSDKKHRVEFESEDHEVIAIALDTLIGLSNLKEMS